MIASILIVEDDDLDRELIFKAMHTECNNIRCVRRLREAIEQIQLEEPDVIILDVGLPDALNHEDAIQRVKSVVTKAAIVVLSNNDNPDDILKGILRNASGWLVKGSWVNLPYEVRAAYDNFQALMARSKIIHECRTSV